MTSIFGTDIMLGSDFQAKIASNGELILINGADTVIQDIKLMLSTSIGSLFYDVKYGSNLLMFIHDDEANTTDIETEIIRRLELDSRIEPYSTTVSVAQNISTITITINFKLIADDTPLNLVLSLNKKGLKL